MIKRITHGEPVALDTRRRLRSDKPSRNITLSERSERFML